MSTANQAPYSENRAVARVVFDVSFKTSVLYPKGRVSQFGNNLTVAQLIGKIAIA